MNTIEEKIIKFNPRDFDGKSKNDAPPKSMFYAGIGEDLVPEGIFERFPLLIPAVGDHYWRKHNEHKKLLIVGESNYLRPNEYLDLKQIYTEPERWYKSEADRDAISNLLGTEDIKKRFSNWKGSRHTGKLRRVIREVLDDCKVGYDKKYPLNEVAYYNYFLRPAEKIGGRYYFGNCCKDLDEKVAYSALSEIIYRLEANIVIFASTLAYEKFDKFHKDKTCNYYPAPEHIFKVDHPSYWDTAQEKKYGKNNREEFRKLLQKYWVNPEDQWIDHCE